MEIEKNSYQLEWLLLLNQETWNVSTSSTSILIVEILKLNVSTMSIHVDCIGVAFVDKILKSGPGKILRRILDRTDTGLK